MQYLPVVFAVFQVFFLAGLVIYYIAQAILRIALQHYITKAFYGHDEALGRQAQRASEHARELAKQDGEGSGGGGGLFAQARRDLGASKPKTADAATATATTAAVAGTTGSPRPTKRTTEPKNRPTPSGKGASGRPPKGASRPGGPRSKSAGKRPR
jgi:YidC/Oxa1 family membrane protein insertase